MTDEPKFALVTDRPHAPVVYFEEAPALAHVSGIIAVTLCAAFQLPESDGINARGEKIVTAYLRTNVIGARILRDVLDKAILIAQQAASEAKN